MLKYFKTLKSAQRYANNKSGSEILAILIDKEAKDFGDDHYVVASQSGLNHLNQMNWDYDIVETWE